MAVHPLYPNIAAPGAAPDSDYGSDIDDATAEQLFSQVESESPLSDTLKETVLPHIEEPFLIAELEEDVYPHNFSVRLARLRQSLDGVEESRAKLEAIVQRRRREAAMEVEYDERNRSAFSPSIAEGPDPTKATPETPSRLKKDTRSPLQRFKARRPLSVTNLVSPSWCEQQYEYNLSHHGRIPQTKAMSAGTSVHKELEVQVHVEVPVEVVSREDRFGLKLWNTIQGLRALRETGLTRELEVWGVLEGEVVNGIIDEVTGECPDAEQEVRVLRQMSGEGGGEGKGGKGKKEPQLAPDQRTLTEFLTGSQGGSVLEGGGGSAMGGTPASFLGTLSEPDRPTPTYYLKDIKTTKRDRPPSNPAYTRGAHIQLMLYHRILYSLAADEVPAQQIFERYRLDAQAKFSDKFIAELANLDMRAFVSVPDEADLPASQQWQHDPLAELLAHNTLASLWELLVKEMQRTFPSTPTPTNPSNTTASQPSTPALSPLLTVEYRSSAPSTPGKDSLIGRHSFPHDPKRLADYVKSEMSWWRGERATVGVSLEDAWKCGWCEFAGECEWRRDRVEEGVERARMRKVGFLRSGV